MIDSIIMIKREKYKAKRIKMLERKKELEDEGKSIEALAVTFAIDQIQETLTDLLDMENEIKNYQEYKESCNQLINNQINKKNVRN